MSRVERIFDLPYNQLKEFPQTVAFSTKTNGSWIPTSTQEFINAVEKIAKGLIELGVESKDMIGIVSTNRMEWDIADMAILSVGAISVPLYPNISTDDYKYIFNDAKLKMAFVGTDELYQKIEGIRSDIPTLGKMFCFDKHEGIPHYSIVSELGAGHTMEKVDERKKLVTRDMLATLIYTSGTTGFPKGVMLSHENLLSNAEGCFRPIPANEGDRVLSFLPTCHSYERMLHYLYMYLGCNIYYAESMETIGDNIREVKPHLFTAVPRLIEKVYDKIIAKGEALTGIKFKLFFWAVSVGNEYEPEGKSLGYKIKLAIARKLIFSKWKEALGGNVNAIASGSAALQPRLARIFLAAGIPILEGYGLTETSPVISVNCFKKGVKIGTVGPLLDNVQVMFAEDGEICVKGPNVMLGYYNLPDKTAEVMDAEGWFHTGDIGEMIDGKFLKITDRKKELFKTSGGKYIVPQAIENKLKASRFIEQAMIIGEGQKFPAAIIVANVVFIREWAKRKGITIPENAEDIVANELVKNRIGKAIEGVNATLGNWEQVKKFELLPKEWTIEGGELTPTLKLKRKVIMQKYAENVDRIYSSSKGE